MCENVVQTAQNYATQAQLSAESAEDYLKQMQNTGYGVDLSFTDNTLQLLDQNGDDLGNPVTISAGTDRYKGIYDDTVTYNQGDYVLTNISGDNVFWMCLQNNTVGKAPYTYASYWSRITNFYVNKVDPKSDNVNYQLGLVIPEATTSSYFVFTTVSPNAPKVNAQTGEIVGYATKAYVDNAVGNIETLLHNINTGE